MISTTNITASVEPSLPIETVLPDLLTSLGKNNSVVLSADPGAGKTTRVPLALLHADWLKEQKVIMLEPRRLAAVRSAHYMATLLDERVGQIIGYRIRGEQKVSKHTRVETVTEGILTSMLQSDPALYGIGLLIIDACEL